MGFVDKIFTRVGAAIIFLKVNQHLVEMLEAASIVNNISDRAILLDEIGRGTSLMMVFQ